MRRVLMDRCIFLTAMEPLPVPLALPLVLALALALKPLGLSLVLTHILAATAQALLFQHLLLRPTQVPLQGLAASVSFWPAEQPLVSSREGVFCELASWRVLGVWRCSQRSYCGPGFPAGPERALCSEYFGQPSRCLLQAQLVAGMPLQLLVDQDASEPCLIYHLLCLASFLCRRLSQRPFDTGAKPN